MGLGFLNYLFTSIQMRRSGMKGLKVLSVLLLIAAMGWSDPITVVIQDVDDAYISSTSTGSNYGTSADLVASYEMCSS